MADKEQSKNSGERVSREQRLNYIGFDVFPGKPGNLFKSDNERDSIISRIKGKREHHDQIREDCTLMVERVNSFDRIVLAVTSAAIIIALIFPWYSFYNEFVEETKASQEPTEQIAVVDSLATDSNGVLLTAESDMTDTTATTDTTQAFLADNSLADTTAITEEAVSSSSDGLPSNETIITGLVARKKITKEYDTSSGLGGLISIGSTSSYFFSSGISLMVTAILMIIYTLMCLGFPAYSLYGIYGLKGKSDEKALALKKIMSFNWIPIILFFVVFIISFVGAEYSFDPKEVYTSLGASYGPGIFVGSLSWGVLVSLGGFILLALKGGEI